MLIRNLSLAAGLAAFVLAAGPALAQSRMQGSGMQDQTQMQNQLQQQELQQRTQPQSQIPPQKLDAAASVVKDVNDLQRSYQPRIDAAASPADKQKVVGEEEQAAEKAVTDRGLTVDEFKQIMQVAKNDPNIRNEITRRMQPEGQQ
ncbi:MAG TPA: DUF4168 domain-containing protein [Stellaceae bacterium]|nr:DUF4168 domain-containing protein [Stellaceae bacterium]